MLLALFVACVAPSDTAHTGLDTAPGDAFTPLGPIAWEPCDLYTSGGGPPAECATVATPLRHDQPEGPTIEVFVKRYHPEGGSGARAMWMLQGGPGASGQVFEGISDLFSRAEPDVDYYFPDHRGTGRSTRLGCAAEDEDSEEGRTITDAEWDLCRDDAVASLGEELSAFTTTNAANDVGLLVDAVARETGAPQVVYGVSYGTYWAHRYLQLFPDQADGVILDSMAAPGLSLYRQDEDANTAAELLFGACAADAFCASKLGEDPWAVAEGLVADLHAGHCPEIAVEGDSTQAWMRRGFGSMLMGVTWREYLPAVVYRAARCGPEDIEPLRRFMAAITQPAGESLELELWGFVLTQNVIRSEFGEEPMPTAAELAAIREGAVASRDVTDMLEETLDWPVYPADPYMGAFAETDTPMLMLQGGLDPATLLEKARPYEAHFTGAHQTWVEFPTASHTTFVSTPTRENAVDVTRGCARTLIFEFLADPRGELDTSCVAEVLPLDLALSDTEKNQALLGTGDAWE